MQAADRVGHGNFEQTLSVSSEDELGDLARAFNRMAMGLRDREKERDLIRQNLGRYVGDEVAQKILDASDHLLQGERRHVTVLFTDVRGFTSMAEKLAPNVVLGTLNEHFSELIEVLFEFEGTLDKFLGDGLMGVFGAPVPHEDHAERAVKAALRMQDRIAALNAGRRQRSEIELLVGIGINSGVVVAGTVGSRRRMEYSVIGDTVNIAARLQGLANGGQIIVGQSTYEAIKDIATCEPLDPVKLKGREDPIQVYRVTCLRTGHTGV